MPTTTLTRDEYMLAMSKRLTSTLYPFYSNRENPDYTGEGDFSIALLSNDLAWDEID